MIGSQMHRDRTLSQAANGVDGVAGRAVRDSKERR